MLSNLPTPPNYKSNHCSNNIRKQQVFDSDVYSVGWLCEKVCLWGCSGWSRPSAEPMAVVLLLGEVGGSSAGQSDSSLRPVLVSPAAAGDVVRLV